MFYQQIKDFYETATNKTHNEITPYYVREHRDEIIDFVQREQANAVLSLWAAHNLDLGAAEIQDWQQTIAWCDELLAKLRSTLALTKDQAKNLLLDKLYHCRYKPTMGGYEGWLRLLELYYAVKYADMYEFISNCRGMGGKTRSECLEYIEIIMED